MICQLTDNQDVRPIHENSPWFGDSVYHVSVNRYLVAKGKALVMRLEKKLYRLCQLSTDTPPIPCPFSADGSLIHCRHPTNAITMTVHRSVDQHLTDPQSTVRHHLADVLTNSWQTLNRYSDWHIDWLSTKMLANILLNSRYKRHGP